MIEIKGKEKRNWNKNRKKIIQARIVFIKLGSFHLYQRITSGPVNNKRLLLSEAMVDDVLRSIFHENFEKIPLKKCHYIYFSKMARLHLGYWDFSRNI